MKKTFKNRLLCLCMALAMVVTVTACQSGDVVEAGRPSGVGHEEATSTPNKPPVSTESDTSSEESEIIEEDKIAYPLKLYFSSGVAAWYTEVVIHADGSFEGFYHDNDMGDAGEEYPNGTLYQCVFRGRFSKPQKLNDYAYSLTLESVEVDNEGAEDYIADGMLVIQAKPNGLMNADGSGYATEFLLFTPNAEIEALQNDYQDKKIEEFLLWWPGRSEEHQNGKLNGYGLLNTHTGDGFFN